MMTITIQFQCADLFDILHAQAYSALHGRVDGLVGAIHPDLGYGVKANSTVA